MKPEQCKGCMYLHQNTFCKQFKEYLNEYTRDFDGKLIPIIVGERTILTPIVCIPECEYAKGKS